MLHLVDWNRKIDFVLFLEDLIQTISETVHNSLLQGYLRYSNLKMLQAFLGPGGFDFVQVLGDIAEYC